MLSDKEKISILSIIFSLIMIGIFFPNEKKEISDKNTNSLRSDYAKVVITWNPPNNAPTISSGPAENPASTSISPTNVGSDVTFQATAIDGDGDNYYLAICKTNAITANNNAPPTCTGGDWCVSGSIASASQASCATTTLAAWDTSNPWYAFVCDYHASDSKCSSSNQGSGDSGSPFEVNHPPVDFSNYYGSPTPLDPGDDINLWATVYNSGLGYSDPDSDSVNLFFCKTQSANSSGCTSAQWCNQTECGAECSCQSSAPTPSEGTQDFYVYVFDEHGLGASNNGASNTFTVNNVAPSVSNITINGGVDIDLSDGGEGTSGNKDINITADVTDNNGCDDIVSASVRAYPTGVGSGGCTSQNDNNCYYNISCTKGSCSGSINQAYTCTVNFKYHADPTDAGTIRVAETWKASVGALDEGASGSAEGASGVELQSFVSLNVDNQIDYGQLASGQMANGDSLVTTTKVYASGNVGIDVNISGTNMTGAGTINVGQQKYATSSIAYSSATALSGTATEFELNVKKPTTTSALPWKNVYWGLQVPGGAGAGSYSGTNTFSAVKGETADW